MFLNDVKYDRMKMVNYMTSRMDKYYNNDNRDTESRTRRNENRYREIDERDFENVNISNNVSVLNTDTQNMDLDELRALLDQKYRSKQSRVINTEDLEDTSYEDLEDTKEYDLKKVLESAHANRQTDYDQERYKKLRETQYDILNSLNIERKEEPEPQEAMSVEDTNLMNLIKTVNDNALRNKLDNALSNDLMSDLTDGGTDNDKLDPLTFDNAPEKKPTIVEELEKTKQLSRESIDKELLKVEDVKPQTEKIELSKTDELANSFYTGKLQIDDKDMEDFKDLESAMASGKVVVKILIVLIVLIVIAVAVFLLNKYLNLNLF